MQKLPARNSILGEGMLIRRALPHRERRLIGAWCFLDHAGPVEIGDGAGVRVGPHPHIGLQTFTWMIEGEILHRDSLGYTQIIRPGQVNLMTAGRGISHSEETPAQHSSRLQLAQLWIALPDAKRHIEPAFEHYPDLPRFAVGDFGATLLVGEAAGQTSPVRVHTPLVAFDLASPASASGTLPLRADFEHGVLVLEGSVEIDGQALEAGTLLYIEPSHAELAIKSTDACRLLVIGGEPFDENVLLWWNFVARTQAEIVAATHAWNVHTDFGTVEGYEGAPLAAPEVPGEIKSSKQ